MPNSTIILKKFLGERTDLVVGSFAVLQYYMDIMKIKQPVERAFMVSNDHKYYLAFSRKTPDPRPAVSTSF